MNTSPRTSRPSGVIDLGPWLAERQLRASLTSLPPSPAIAASVVAPAAPAPPRGLTSRATLLLALAALIVASAALGLALADRGEVDGSTRVEPSREDPAAATPAPASSGEAPSASPGPTTPASSATSAPAEPTAPAETADSSGEPRSGSAAPASPRPRTTRPVHRPSAPPSAAPATGEPGTDEPSGDETLDDLLDRALRGGTAGAETPAERLPETPSRDQVLSVMRSLSDEVAQCREPGADRAIVTTRVAVAGATGRVTRASVGGELAWTPAGACVTRALETARFPRFARDQLEVSFPYRL